MLLGARPSNSQGRLALRLRLEWFGQPLSLTIRTNLSATAAFFAAPQPTGPPPRGDPLT